MPSTRSKNRTHAGRRIANFGEENDGRRAMFHEEDYVGLYCQNDDKILKNSTEFGGSTTGMHEGDFEEEKPSNEPNCHFERKTTMKGRKAQTEETMRWLEENYVMCEGVCLPRCILYAHYLDFCRQNKMEAACAATFGKTIRQKFPQLTTRRLGTRGHSKYHYYGIGIKETSTYYHSVYSGKGLTRFSSLGIKQKNEGTFVRKYSPSSRTGTLLPDFPNPKMLQLPEIAPVDKVNTLIIMYKTHCQCILDTAINSNFAEINSFLLHFWRGMPNHLLPILDVAVVANLICLCDSILYKVLVDVLVPSTMQDMPESLLTEIRGFARQIEGWVKIAIGGFPEYLVRCKLHAARQFAFSVKIQTTFLHLAQTARYVIQSKDTTKQMIDDLENVDQTCLGTEAMFTSYNELNKRSDIDKEVLDMLKTLLDKQAVVEEYVEWMDNIVERRVMKPDVNNKSNFKKRAQEFLLQWSFTSTRLMNNLTLNNCKSFGAFHLLKLLMDEYMILIIETRVNHEFEEKMQQNLDSNLKEDDSNAARPFIRMASFTTKTKFTVPANQTLPVEMASKIFNPKNSAKTTVHRKKRTNQRKSNTLTSSPSKQTLRRRRTKSEDGKEFDNHSPGTTALTPPVSPLYNLQSPSLQSPSLQSPSLQSPLNYTDLQIEYCMDYQAVDAEPIRTENVSSETVENLVSEHFRNCGVDLSRTEATDFNVFHCNQQEPYQHSEMNDRYTVNHQSSIAMSNYPYHHNQLLEKPSMSETPSGPMYPQIPEQVQHQCNKGRPLINHQPQSSMIFYPDGNVSDSISDSYMLFNQDNEVDLDCAVDPLLDRTLSELWKSDDECDHPSLPSINSLLNLSPQMF